MIRHKWLYIISLCALGATLLIQPGLTQAQSSFVTAHNGSFIVNGQQLRFIGVNIRKLVYMTPAEQDAQLTAARSMGVKVIRVYAARTDKSNADIIAALKNLLGRVAADNDIQVYY